MQNDSSVDKSTPIHAASATKMEIGGSFAKGIYEFIESLFPLFPDTLSANSFNKEPVVAMPFQYIHGNASSECVHDCSYIFTVTRCRQG